MWIDNQPFYGLLTISWLIVESQKNGIKLFCFVMECKKNFLSPLKCVDVIAILWPSKLPSNMLGIASNIINKNGYKVTRNQCYEKSKFLMQFFVNLKPCWNHTYSKCYHEYLIRMYFLTFVMKNRKISWKLFPFLHYYVMRVW